MDAGHCRYLTCAHTNTYLSVLSARMRFSAHSLYPQNNKRNTSKNNETEERQTLLRGSQVCFNSDLCFNPPD